MFQPNFTYTNKIVRLLTRIQAAREVVLNSPVIPSWEKRLQRDAMIRQTHHTTSIEGNPLTLEEVTKLIDGKNLLAHEKDKREILNYLDVLKYIDRLKKKGPITEETVLEIHRLTVKDVLPEKNAGHYRKVQVVVGVPQTGEITFVPPKAEVVPLQMTDFIEWLNHEESQELMPAVQAGIAHYELARVHPFVDGNGRTARALATLILTKRGFDTKKFFALEEYYNKERPAYYAALATVDPDTRDLTRWLEYFLFGIAVEISRVEKTVLDLSTDRAQKEKYGQIGLSSRQIKAIKYIQENGQITNKEHQQLCGISPSTAKRDLQEMVDKNVIEQVGEAGKGVRYLLKT